MRTIKFRAYVYCPINEKYEMRQHESIENNCGAFFFQPEKYTPNPHIIMQFTGLHDKNGKEIYEGDIVEITYVEHEKHIFDEPLVYTGTVVYDMAQFEVQNQGEFITLLGYNNEPAGEPEFTIKVIGNIHENPELLNQ